MISTGVEYIVQLYMPCQGADVAFRATQQMRVHFVRSTTLPSRVGWLDGCKTMRKTKIAFQNLISEGAAAWPKLLLVAAVHSQWSPGILFTESPYCSKFKFGTP